MPKLSFEIFLMTLFINSILMEILLNKTNDINVSIILPIDKNPII